MSENKFKRIAQEVILSEIKSLHKFCLNKPIPITPLPQPNSKIFFGFFNILLTELKIRLLVIFGLKTFF